MQYEVKAIRRNNYTYEGHFDFLDGIECLRPVNQALLVINIISSTMLSFQKFIPLWKENGKKAMLSCQWDWRSPLDTTIQPSSSP